MHRIILASVAMVICAPASRAAEVKSGVAGKNVRTVRFQSEALGEARTVNMLLPADYDTSTRRYPTLYLLHGLGDDHTAWSLMTNVSEYAAGYPIIIVMPDAGRSFYLNSAADPKARFEDFIVKDLIDWVDSHYRSIPLRRSRAVAGLSMGGYGAALIGLKHYENFAALGSFSGAVGIARPEAATIERYREWQKVLGPPNSPERADHDPFALLEKVPPAEMPDIYLACGGQDRLIEQNRDFTKLLADKKVAYEYREVSPRGHTWDFWDDNIRIFLDRLSHREGWR